LETVHDVFGGCSHLPTPLPCHGLLRVPYARRATAAARARIARLQEEDANTGPFSPQKLPSTCRAAPSPLPTPFPTPQLPRPTSWPTHAPVPKKLWMSVPAPTQLPSPLPRRRPTCTPPCCPRSSPHPCPLRDPTLSPSSVKSLGGSAACSRYCCSQPLAFALPRLVLQAVQGCRLAWLTK